MTDRDDDEPIDVEALMADIRRRVERKKAQGLYSVDELAAESLDTTEPLGVDELERLRPMAAVRVDLGVAGSDKPFVGRAIDPLKRRLVRGVSQPLFGVADQTGRFNAGLLAYAAQLGREAAVLKEELGTAVERAEQARLRSDALSNEIDVGRESLKKLSERIAKLERSDLGTRVAQIEERNFVESARAGEAASLSDPGRLGAVLESRDPVQGDVAWTGLESSPDAPIIHVGCGSGASLESLGEGAFGVEADRALATSARRDGREVICADPVVHVAGLTGRSLGGALVTNLTERLDGQALLRLFTSLGQAVAEGEQIVVVFGALDDGGEGWRDPLRVRPFHPDALVALAEAAGLNHIRVVDAPPGPSGDQRHCLRARS